MKALVFMLGLLVAVPLPALAETWGAQQLMQALAQVKRSESRFVEKKSSVYLAVPLTVTGFLLYEAPLRLEKHSVTPVDERFAVIGDRVSIEREVQGKRVSHQITLADYPALRPFVESVRATLAGDLATLERFYVVACNGTAERWQLHLLPREAELRELVTEVRIAGRHDAIHSIEVREASGDSSLMTILPAK